jgi:hypothetical protein
VVLGGFGGSDESSCLGGWGLVSDPSAEGGILPVVHGGRGGLMIGPRCNMGVPDVVLVGGGRLCVVLKGGKGLTSGPQRQGGSAEWC